MYENLPEYDELLDYYKQIRVFVKGLKGVQKYLQDVTPKENDNTNRNKQYKERAKYTNFPQRTRNGLLGSVFRKDIKCELPESMEFLKENVNGAGLTLAHLAKSTVGNIIEVGRHGLFVDYGNNQPKIVQYVAEAIPYYETDENGKLSLVKLKKNKDEYRLLILEDSAYRVETRSIEDDELTEEPITPTKADGSNFDYIPFIFIGSEDNSPDFDIMPLWSIVDVAQGHYQNSADYEDLLKYLIPTPYATVPNKQWIEDVLPNGVYSFGDGAIIPVPEGGSAGILQANENQMHAEAMKHKENQLVMIGARMIMDSSKQETAEAVKIKFSSENSVLDNLVENTQSAIKKCLVWCCDYLNIPSDDVVFELNREYFDTTMSAQEISAMIMLEDRGTISRIDTRNRLRKTGYIEKDRTDEEIDDDIREYGAGL